VSTHILTTLGIYEQKMEKLPLLTTQPHGLVTHPLGHYRKVARYPEHLPQQWAANRRGQTQMVSPIR
jgi:hypothetical protein